MASDRVEGLRSALALDPENHALRLVLAETLAADGRAAEAADEYRVLLDAEQLPPESMVEAGHAALAAGNLDLAAKLASAAREAGVVEGAGDLLKEIDEQLGLGGTMRLVRTGGPEDEDDEAVPLELDDDERVTFAQVGGLEEVKKTVHRTIILPFQRPDLYERYGRRAGGGVLLYGPPGCGKTLLARATAGECGLPFANVRIEEVLDPYLGLSERNLHDTFEQARNAAPCVVFVDELDAIGFARRKHTGSAGRQLVNLLLEELDSIGSNNAELLVLGATNAPWDVDEALKRPGRFDRLLFVPPPDEPARRRVLEIHLAAAGADKVDVDALARKTPLFSGADLRSLVQRGVDLVIDEALDSGGNPPLTTKHLERALQGMRPTTLEWLATARNYVEFANQGGRYDEVSAFLVSPEAKRWKD